MTMTTTPNPKTLETYGRCPMCGKEGVTRERRPNGNDICISGHVYPSCKAIIHPSNLVTDEAAMREAFKAGFLLSCGWHNPSESSVDGFAYGVDRDRMLAPLLAALTSRAIPDGHVAVPAAELPSWWGRFIQNVCELPDRTSPEDEPGAMTATAPELEQCALSAMEQANGK